MKMVSIGAFGFLKGLIAVCLLLGIGAEKFNVVLHYDKINHHNLATHGFNSKTLLDTHTLTLNQRLQALFKDEDLKVEIYDVIESGIEEGYPAIALSAHVNIPSFNSREAFVNAWEQSEHPDLILFSVYQTENPIPEDDGVHRFHVNYAAKAANKCVNNGVLLPNATCVCPSYFSGDDCSIQTCLNGGIISTSEHCVCPPGFAGRHCEQLACTPFYDSEFNFTTKSFVLAVNLKYDAAFLIENIYLGLVDALVSNAATFKNYVLITYVMTGYKMFTQVKVIDTAEHFLGNFTTIYPNDGDSYQPHITAINSALTSTTKIHPRSDIYTFWASRPLNDTVYNPYDLSKNSGETVLTKTLLNWGHAFYTITLYNEMTVATKAFIRLSAISNGEYINLNSRTSDARPLLAALIKNNVHAQTLDVYRNFWGTVNIVLSQMSTPIIAYTYGKNIVLSVQTVTQTPIATYGSFSIFNINAKASSIAIQATTSGNSASIRVFTSSISNVVIGYTKSSLIDVSSNFPIAYIPQTIVARIVDETANLSNTNIVIYDLYDTSRNSQITHIVQPDTKRDCNFPIIYGSLSENNSCTAGEAILISVTYMTTNGQSVYRAIPSVCFQPKPASQVALPPCNSNGYLSNKGSCICNANYAGTYCEKILCQNGGIQNQFPGNGRPQCICPDGFTGALCEKMTCSISATHLDTSRITLNMVVQATWSTSPFKSIFKYISEYFVNVLSNADSYVLTTFANLTNASPLLLTQVFNNSTVFRAALSDYYGGASDLNQSQNVIAALNSALNADVPHPLGQAVYLFVDSPIGEAQVDIDVLIVKAITLATPINVILSMPYQNYGDESITCIDDTSAYIKLAKLTGGVFFNFCPVNDISLIPYFLRSHAKIMPSQTIYRGNEISCGTAFSVHVEQRDGNPKRNLIIISNNPNATYNIEVMGPKNSFRSLSSKNSLAGASIIELVDLNAIGDYTVTAKPINASLTDKCVVILGVQSNQSLFTGFTANPSIDYKTMSPEYGYPSHPVAFLSTALESTPTIKVTIEDGLNNYTSISSLRNVLSCQFDYYFSDAYSCPVPGMAINITARVTNDDGIAYNRQISSICQAPPPGTCLNGGYLDPDDSTCTCPIGFSGNLCQDRICLNDGYVKNGLCVCPQGYSGQLCELIECPSWNFVVAHRESSFQYESVVFVAEMTLHSLVTNMALSKKIVDIVNQIHSSSKPLQLILVTHTPVSIDRVIVTTDPSEFISAVQTTFSRWSDHSYANQSLCLDAVHEAAKLVTYKPAVILAFMSSESIMPTDFFRSVNSLMKLIDRGGLQINFYIHRPDYSLPPPPSNPHQSSSYYYILITAITSGGRIFMLNPSDADRVIKNLVALAVFEDAIIEDQAYDNCTGLQTLYFPVDHNVRTVSVNVRGKRVNNPDSVILYDALGQQVDTYDLGSVVSTGSLVYIINDIASTPKYIGFWRVTVQLETGNCQIQVRAISDNTVQFGFSTNITSDYTSNILNTDTTNVATNFNHSRYITAHIDNQLYATHRTFLDYVKVFGFDMDFAHVNLLDSSIFLPRDHNTCAYQYVSQALTIPNVLFHGLGPLQIVASGQDAYGETFQRIHYTTPQIADCRNGGSPDIYNYCACPAHYTGDYCIEPICLNGATNDGLVCQCADGYYGDFCEKQIVLPASLTS